jgi:hypothetical protein
MNIRRPVNLSNKYSSNNYSSNKYLSNRQLFVRMFVQRRFAKQTFVGLPHRQKCRQPEDSEVDEYSFYEFTGRRNNVASEKLITLEDAKTNINYFYNIENSIFSSLGGDRFSFFQKSFWKREPCGWKSVLSSLQSFFTEIFLRKIVKKCVCYFSFKMFQFPLRNLYLKSPRRSTAY